MSGKGRKRAAKRRPPKAAGRRVRMPAEGAGVCGVCGAETRYGNRLCVGCAARYAL